MPFVPPNNDFSPDLLQARDTLPFSFEGTHDRSFQNYNQEICFNLFDEVTVDVLGDQRQVCWSLQHRLSVTSYRGQCAAGHQLAPAERAPVSW